VLTISLAQPRSFPDRRTLTRADRITVRAIAEAMFSEDGEVEPERLDAHVEEVDAFVSAASKTFRFGLRLALLVVRLSPVLMFFRFCTLEKLAVADRVALLSKLERSRATNISLAFIGWRTIMTLAFYEHPTELRALGYTTDERRRHKRHLLVATAPLSRPHEYVGPPALESGVRIKDPDSENPAAASAAEDGSREVA
jgi:hypothetical protein